jgi:hypothetical protein
MASKRQEVKQLIRSLRQTNPTSTAIYSKRSRRQSGHGDRFSRAWRTAKLSSAVRRDTARDEDGPPSGTESGSIGFLMSQLRRI